MMQNKKISVGLALFAGVLGLGAGGTALALPEPDVGSTPPIVAPQSANSVDATVAEPVLSDEQADAS
ncbi:hypothetical protein GCM10025794_14660 [Massilia kyonggiensis]|nr:hypothetical protein [Massilia kyonggiensis]